MVRLFLPLLFCFSGVVFSAETRHASLSFKGSFAQVSTSSSECEKIFATTEYDLKGFLMGPTGRTFVLNFHTADKTGFFHGLNLVGLFGYNSDFQVEKTLLLGNLTHKIIANGLVSNQVLIADVDVAVYAAKPAGNELVCTASAELSGFN